MIDWISGVIEAMGYVGVAALMFLENVVPPIPSEVIMPLAGFTAARGDMSVAGVVAAGAIGSVAGTLPWYLAARWYGAMRLKRLADRYGRWLGISAGDIDRAQRWFARHGAAAVLIGRLIPGIRTVVSVPPGLCGMALLGFLLWTSVGSALWAALLALTGYLLEERWKQVAGLIAPAGKLILAALAVALVVRAVLRIRRARSQAASD